ncbi:MAG: hypothetical protein WBV89_00805, partial [Ilumatobacter sp.]
VLAALVGLYVGIPETDRIVGILPVIGIMWLGELTGRMRVDGLIVAGLDIVLVWLAVHGSAGRSGAMIAGVALLGLLVVASIIAGVAGPHRIRATERWTMPALVGAQLVFAIAVARLGGVRTTAGEAVGVVIVAIPLLALVTTPLIVRRPGS